MSKRETDAVAKVLCDPENQTRSAEEVAELVIDQLDAVRAQSHRLAVVGQLWFNEAQERPHTVILGPFSARGVLDSRDKFDKVVQGGTAARDAGQHLAWDAKTGKGRGRFMLVPAFKSSRDAWNFFREEEPADPRFAWIADSIANWQAGPWGPACSCAATRPGRIVRTSAGDLVAAGPCTRHPDAT